MAITIVDPATAHVLIARLGARPGWFDRAACRGTPTSMFFPTALKGADARAAVEICGSCPVRVECHEYAVAEHEGDGVWGGVLRDRVRGTAVSNAVRRAPGANGVAV
jgi:WhiB family redox-sensing transcriptional regulator